MPTLQITRSSEYTNRLRSIKLFLDDKELGPVKNGETVLFEIAAGNHLLKAKIDWCSSNIIALHIKENEAKKFNLSSFAKNNPLGILAAIYYISIGANKYLNLKEVL